MRISTHFFKVAALFILFFAYSPTHAQNSRESAPFAHQLSLQYGLVDMTLLEDWFRFTLDAFTPMDLIASPGLPLIEYRFVRQRIGLGITFGARKIQNERLEFNAWNVNRDLQFREANYVLVMPSLEWYWVTQGNYVVSSQLGLGIRYVDVTQTRFNGDTEFFREQRIAYQLSPLVVSYGGRKIQGRFDVGVGHKGFLALGLVYQFW